MQHLPQVQGDVLTDLCSVCHVNAIKYTCPRCSIHTCSLPCVKKHKTRAQCSGVRDPAEYRKRGELTTATSIDKDFNFITKVERAVQRADDNVAQKGISLAPAKPRSHAQTNKSNIDLELETRNITIIRAPKGLSRSKLNRTHWHGASKCILWTTEWIDDKADRRTNNIHEFKTVAEAYIGTFGKKNMLKRKRPASEVIDGASRVQQPKDIVIENTQQVSKTISGVPEQQADHQEPSEHIQLSTLEETVHSTQQLDRNHQCQNHDDVEQKGDRPVAVPTLDEDSSSDVLFFLLRPNTEARYKVLIPIPSDKPLREVLNNKTILEFPTIYAFHCPSANIGPPFLLENDYIQRMGKDIPINITAVSVDQVISAQPGQEELDDTALNMETDLSEARLLETLAKDLSR